MVFLWLAKWLLLKLLLLLLWCVHCTHQVKELRKRNSVKLFTLKLLLFSNFFYNFSALKSSLCRLNVIYRRLPFIYRLIFFALISKKCIKVLSWKCISIRIGQSSGHVHCQKMKCHSQSEKLWNNFFFFSNWLACIDKCPDQSRPFVHSVNGNTREKVSECRKMRSDTEARLIYGCQKCSWPPVVKKAFQYFSILLPDRWKVFSIQFGMPF